VHHLGRAIPEAHTHRDPAPQVLSNNWRADPLNRAWTQDSLSMALSQLSVLGPDELGELGDGQLTASSDASTSSLERALSLERRTSAPELWLGRCATDEMLSSPTKLVPTIALPAGSPVERGQAERASGGGGGGGSGSGGSGSESMASRMAHQRRARMQQRTAQRHSSSASSPNMISPGAILARSNVDSASFVGTPRVAMSSSPLHASFGGLTPLSPLSPLSPIRPMTWGEPRTLYSAQRRDSPVVAAAAVPAAVSVD